MLIMMKKPYFDIIGELPIEISHKIFRYLTMEELGRCLSVSKSWRHKANCEHLWKKYYYSLDLDSLHDEDVVIPKCELVSLCPLIETVQRHLSMRMSNWRQGCYQNVYIVLRYRHWVATCFTRRIALLYATKGELEIHTASKEGLVITDKLQVVIPHSEHAHGFSMGMNRKYLYIGIYNITHIYKNVDNHFIYYKTIAFLQDGSLQITDEEVHSFVLEYIQSNFTLLNRVLANETLWFTSTTGHKHIINLNTMNWFDIKDLSVTKYLQLSDTVLHYAQFGTSVSLTDSTGSKTLNTFTAPPKEKVVYSNKRIVLLTFPKYCQNEEMDILCWYLREMGGTFLRMIKIAVPSRLTLHPFLERLFCLTTRVGLYKLSCVDLTTGDTMWAFERTEGTTTYYGSFVAISVEKYLIVYPGPTSDSHFACFTFDGQFMYEKLFTMGVMIHFSDDMVVSKEDHRLQVWKFC